MSAAELEKNTGLQISTNEVIMVLEANEANEETKTEDYIIPSDGVIKDESADTKNEDSEDDDFEEFEEFPFDEEDDDHEQRQTKLPTVQGFVERQTDQKYGLREDYMYGGNHTDEEIGKIEGPRQREEDWLYNHISAKHLKKEDLTPADMIPNEIQSVNLCMILIKAHHSTKKISVNGEERSDMAEYYSDPDIGSNVHGWQYVRFVCGATEVHKIKTITVDKVNIRFQKIAKEKWTVNNTDGMEQIEEQKYYEHKEGRKPITLYFEIVNEVMAMEIDETLKPNDGKYLDIWQLDDGFDDVENIWKLLWKKSRDAPEGYGFENLPLWGVKPLRTAQFYHDARTGIIFILPMLVAKNSMAINGKKTNTEFCSLSDCIKMLKQYKQ